MPEQEDPDLRAEQVHHHRAARRSDEAQPETF
jgi:hypothetical protein